jgi:hypothetical protein
MHKDHKTHVATPEAEVYVKSSTQKISRIAEKLHSQVSTHFHMTLEDAKTYAEVVVRSDYAHSKSFTVAALKNSTRLSGHVPYNAEQIMYQHPLFSRASDEIQSRCLDQAEEGSVLGEKFKKQGTNFEGDFDEVEIPESFEQQLKRIAGKHIKSDCDHLTRWRFTLINAPDVVKRIEAVELQKQTREEEKKLQDIETAQLEECMLAYMLGSRYDPGDMEETLKDLYGWQESDVDARCQCCSNWKSTWVVGDIRRKYKQKAWCKEGELQWCLLTDCNNHRLSFKTQAKENKKNTEQKIENEKAEFLDLYLAGKYYQPDEVTLREATKHYKWKDGDLTTQCQACNCYKATWVTLALVGDEKKRKQWYCIADESGKVLQWCPLQHCKSSFTSFVKRLIDTELLCYCGSDLYKGLQIECSRCLHYIHNRFACSGIAELTLKTAKDMENFVCKQCALPQ